MRSSSNHQNSVGSEGRANSMGDSGDETEPCGGGEKETHYCLSSASDLTMTEEEFELLINHLEPDTTCIGDLASQPREEPHTLHMHERSRALDETKGHPNGSIEGTDRSFLELILSSGLVLSSVIN